MKKALLALFVVCSLVTPMLAIDMSTEIDAAATAVLPQVKEWRRFIHQHPELSNREFNTSKLVADKLKEFGLEVRTGVAHTGVVGILKGGKPGPVVALRADMDALPVTERVDVPFKSTVIGEYNGQKVGVMHACGHDSHVAMLLGTAKVLSGMRDKVPGTVVFLFQPAEEGAPAGEDGGASMMVREGALDNPKVDAVFGLHINSHMEIGKIGWKAEGFMAAADILTIKVHGKQSHGAYPWNGVDPIAVATQIYTGLQMIVSRESELPRSPVVITIGRIQGGVRNNIIPEDLVMEGTIRTLDLDVQKAVHDKIRLTATKIAESMGATVEVNIKKQTPITYNTPALVEKMLPSLQKAAGSGNVVQMQWVTGAEDFAFYRDKAPAFFFNLGGMPAGQDPAKAPDHHTPDFYIDDSKLDVGVKAFCNIVFDYAGK
ncbi:MAG: amidohydrolase [Acidobacteria bacterium]|nr:amidohydrolase [Acidobacteriota bacterium]